MSELKSRLLPVPSIRGGSGVSSAGMPSTSNPAKGSSSDWVQMLNNGFAFALLALAACWLLLFDELRGEWEINEQYNFGWVVPVLGAALLYQRWPDRPSANPPSSNLPVMIVAGALLFLTLPFRIIIEANPEWRMVYWLHAGQVIGLSCCLLYRLGGWNWVKFFIPSFLFMLIAIPWPMGLETALIQGLMKFVAGLTVEAAGWLSIPAVQRGNLIEVGVGVVGIDEACSGVNSLQAALMISLFLGEMHRFGFKGRIGLLVGSILFVIAANLTRTTFLVWAAANHGLKQMEAWHDAAGWMVMVVVLAGMFVLANCTKPRNVAQTAGSREKPIPFGEIPRWVGMAVLGWLGLVLVVTEGWYRVHEKNLPPRQSWAVAWPTENPEFKTTNIPEKSLAILRCSKSEAAVWLDDENNQWSGFLLRWEPGRNSAQLAKGHSPEICFPAAGVKIAEDFGTIPVKAHGIELPFRHMTFENGSTLLHVFYCLWSDRNSSDSRPILEDGSQASRIQAVLAGKRNLGQQVLELVVQGPESRETAIALLQEKLPQLIKPL